MFDAVVLAGGGKPDLLTQQEGVNNKAFIPVKEKPLLGHILTGLQEAPSIARLFVVGPEEELRTLQKEGYDFTLVPEQGGMLENVEAALKQVDRSRLCLVATGDIPLLNARVVEGFLALCAPYDHDFYYPILTKESCESRFPETRRTYVRLKEGCFTGGNVALLNPNWFLEALPRLEIFVSYRKKPLKLFRLLPLSFLFKYLVHSLTVADLERQLSSLMQVKARAVPCDFVEIGTDVDKPSDLEAVRGALE
ncbi:MAG: nucleotidyltransferase family protein [Dethiobacteria bacterium]|jgi:CTP:molybdopterin cytidylyltransferase MocA|nr:NTP transferase domain-containing protein [Bacillota bacterium]HOP69862.1 nucleotidyltransferase family protein [Bacillota bacterium]HPT34594.1 nucleotidyltransferase family protein [Bacillota bacterium]